MSVISLTDRVRGCILAGAIGDAMGLPFEGRAAPVKYHEPEAWTISDDTQLTLATCESIGQVNSVLPEHIAESMVRWFKQRRITGIGASTLKALRELEVGQHWALAGAKGEMSAGNGAAMRVAPLAFLLNPESVEDRRTLRDVCRITHHHEEAYIGGLAVVLAVFGIVFRDVSLGDLLAYVADSLPDSRVRDQLLDIMSISETPEVFEIGIQFGNSGYVVESVPLALYAAQRLDTIPFKQVLINAVRAGGDTDTIASVAGQISGAAIGLSSIPDRLLQLLPDKESLFPIVDKFAEHVGQI